LFFANFQITNTPMTCSFPIRMWGPAGIGASQVSSESAVFPESSAERAMEMAFSARDSRPARKAWLFEDAVHANTSSDMPFV
jgi:hypothetical protein